MSSTETPIDMLEPIEDRGGAAQPLLQVNGLTKHFPVRGEPFQQSARPWRAVDDVSFSIAKGETVGIVGEIRLRQVDHGAAFDAPDDARCRRYHL